MAPHGSKHIPLGKKIYSLVKNQAELAKILDVTQQSISGKLNGKMAISLNDLELLAEAYDVPLIYFLSGPEITPALARRWESILNGHIEIQQAVEILATFPRPFAQMLLQTVKAVQQTASFYTDERLQAAESAALIDGTST